jgi:hypothetical protein
MTHHSVNDLASSFVEMAKAYERLPHVESELKVAIGTISDLQNTIQRLELQAIDRNNEIHSLQVSIRKLEEARDDAELRFLECDDAKTTLERTLEGLGKDIASVLAAVQPLPRAEPTPVVIIDVPLVDGSLVSPVPFAEGTSQPDASSTDAVSGQSEADPTAAPTTHTDMNSIHTEEGISASTVEVTSSDGVSVPSNPTPMSVPTVEPVTDTQITVAKYPWGVGHIF